MNPASRILTSLTWLFQVSLRVSRNLDLGGIYRRLAYTLLIRMTSIACYRQEARYQTE